MQFDLQPFQHRQDLLPLRAGMLDRDCQFIDLLAQLGGHVCDLVLDPQLGHAERDTELIILRIVLLRERVGERDEAHAAGIVDGVELLGVVVEDAGVIGPVCNPVNAKACQRSCWQAYRDSILAHACEWCQGLCAVAGDQSQVFHSPPPFASRAWWYIWLTSPAGSL